MIKISKEQKELLERGTKIVTGNGTFYYMPHWFCELPDGTWEVHTLDGLPPSLVEAINDTRTSTEEIPVDIRSPLGLNMTFKS